MVGTGLVTIPWAYA
jgi:amino acid permease